MKKLKISQLISKIKTFVVVKPVISIAIGVAVIAIPVAGIITYNLSQGNDNEEIIYIDETLEQDGTKDDEKDIDIDKEEEKEKLKEELKKENDKLSDEELDKLVEETLNKKDDATKEETSNKEEDSDKKEEETSNKEEDKNSSNEDKPVTENKPVTNTTPSTPVVENKPVTNPTPSTPVVENKPVTTPPVTENKPVTPTPQPTPTPPIVEEKPAPVEPEKPSKPSGIDWELSSRYMDLIASANSNDAILPVSEWNATVDSIFLNGGSAAQVVSALDTYRYKGKEVFVNYGAGIGVDAIKVNLGKNPTDSQVYDASAKLVQYNNYVYLKVYYDNSTDNYTLYLVSGTCNIEPFVFD